MQDGGSVPASGVFEGDAMTGKRKGSVQPWVMPSWMEPYRNMIVNTGGNTVEEMMNGDANPMINLPLSTLQACVKSQVLLLELLHKKGIV